MPAAHSTPNPKRILTSLAAQFNAPVDDVESLYEQERAGLAADARVTTFLHVFAVRHVEDILRKRALAQPGPTAGARQLQSA